MIPEPLVLDTENRCYRMYGVRPDLQRLGSYYVSPKADKLYYVGYSAALTAALFTSVIP